MNHRPSLSSSAFTLIELLVVIAVIAILASLIFPVISKMQETGSSTRCSSNLRQIGGGIVAYCNDNDNLLPGPLSLSQYPAVGTDPEKEKGSLAAKIGRYLDMESKQPTTPGQVRASVFVCPSYERVVKAKDGPVFVMNPKELEDMTPPQMPWGGVQGDTQPLRKPVLSMWTHDTEEGTDRPVDLTRTWALKDADQSALARSGKAPEDREKMAAKPVHGDHRNALFYDFHVGKLDLEDRRYGDKEPAPPAP